MLTPIREVIVNLKSPPLAIFDASAAMPTNYYRLRLSPEVVIAPAPW